MNKERGWLTPDWYQALGCQEKTCRQRVASRVLAPLGGGPGELRVGLYPV